MTTLLESAFNTFYDYNVDFEKIHSHEFVQGYKHHFDELTKIFGNVDFKNIDATETKKIAQDMADRAFAYGLDKFGDVAEATMDTVAAGLGLTGVGIPAGALTAAAGWALDEVLDKIAGMISEEDIPLVKGDWCVMDESGLFRRRLPGVGAGAVEFGGGHTETNKDTKLCVFLGNHGNDREVFNVESGHTRTIASVYVKRVDESHQTALNDNGVLRALKGGLEKARTYDQLLKEVNTRPGDKVVYNEELWEIAPLRKGRYDNDKVLITSNGIYEEVLWSELNPALNDTTAKPLAPDNLGSFVSDAQGINKGDWVYVEYPDMQEYHLGVAQICKGNDVYVVSANQRDDDHWVKADELRKWINQPTSGNLGAFCMAVIEGDAYGISDYRPDKNYTGIVDITAWNAESFFKSKVTSSYLEGSDIIGGTLGRVASVPVADKQYEAEGLRLRGGEDTEPRANGRTLTLRSTLRRGLKTSRVIRRGRC